MDAQSLQKYPNVFSPFGVDFYASSEKTISDVSLSLSDQELAHGTYYSLIGVGGDNLEVVRKVARQWSGKRAAGIADPDSRADLPATFPIEKAATR